MRLSILEGEIETGARHTKVVVRTIDHVPAEIGDPADMRSEAEFDATAELANRPRPRILPLVDSFENRFARAINELKVKRPRATTENRAATTENVRGPLAARNRETERQSTKDRADQVFLT